VFAGCGVIYALDASKGTLFWKQDVVTPTSPAEANGIVYVGSFNSGKVYALDAGTGAELWTYQTQDVVASSPAVANGILYIGSLDNYFYAFGLPHLSK